MMEIEIAEFFIGPIAIPYFKPLWLCIPIGFTGFLIYLLSITWIYKWLDKSKENIGLVQEHDINKVPKEIRDIFKDN